MKHCSRKFKIVGMFLVFSICMFSACNGQPEKITMVNTAMGTVVQETIYITDVERGKEVAQKIRVIIEDLEQETLSWRIDSSEVASINRKNGDASGIPLSDGMVGYLQQIWHVSKKSAGAFDVTVGQVTRLWDLDTWALTETENQKNFHEPDAILLQEVLKCTGYEKVEIEEDMIYLPEGMSLDLGAVGKGIACDRIGELLSTQKEIIGAVISVGGSVVTYGSKPEGGKWNVAIMHPRKEGAYLGTLSLQGEWYVSTSGDYERYVEKDSVRYHHIMDPRTGYPADSGLCSVTILSDSGLLSDALSTACFVLGAEEGIKLAEEFGVEALFVTEDLRMIMSEGMDQYFEEG